MRQEQLFRVFGLSEAERAAAVAGSYPADMTAAAIQRCLDERFTSADVDLM